MKQEYLKQVMILKPDDLDPKDSMSFEEYINCMLGGLYDEGRTIKSIIPMGQSSVFIIYLIKIN